jgi:hypothetical protein
MLRNCARTAMLGLALVQACSGASATGRPAGSAAVRDTTAAERPVARDLGIAAGRTFELRMRTALTSRTNHVGDPVAASVVRAVLSATGDTVIPAGAILRGTVSEIAAAPNPHAQGHLVLAFTGVAVGGAVRPIRVHVDEMATRLEGRGVTGGTVAKVGAGAVLGGLAGRIIGRSGTGTVVGAAAGAAAGGVYAHATRNLDIVLPAGALVRVTTAAPFDEEVTDK